MSKDYARNDDDDCSSHIIGYRFVVWINADRVAVGFNTSPSCRSKSKELISGNARILIFDATGKIHAQRDIPYAADGGEELVASGEAEQGPDHTLLFRIEEAAGAKSGVLLLNDDLEDVARIDQLMEHSTFAEHALVFQQGFISSGPRTYDIFAGKPPFKMNSITEDWPTGTMDRKVGVDGVVYSLCQQELRPEKYSASPIIHAGAQRRCVLRVERQGNKSWSYPLPQSAVAEILGFLKDGEIVGIIRDREGSEQLVIWSQKKAPRQLPWFGPGLSAQWINGTPTLNRYMGVATPRPSKLCNAVGAVCHPLASEIRVFDSASGKDIATRALPKGAVASISPDGLHYAVFQFGRLDVFALPEQR